MKYDKYFADFDILFFPARWLWELS